MKLIAHRGLWKDRSHENTIRALHDAFDLGCGIETDLRSFQGKLYLSHDPILDPSQCASFQSLLALCTYFPRLPVFINIKEDGLVPFINKFRTTLDKTNFIFFDMSIPELIQYAKSFSPDHLATRMSEFEITPAAYELCDWIWVDGFTREIHTSVLKNAVQNYQKNWAFVSPELHGREAAPTWDILRNSEFLPKDQVFLCTDLAEEYLRRAG